ncbi:blue (type 1) copper domain-containing protein [Salinarchaeum sp. Harcht-Bsk1]|nr:blue (type 1) copper domain-containing protein [Salinarchaeum sp. Harcht-Bsk1]
MVQLTGSAVAIGLAGCTSSGSSDGGDSSDDGEESHDDEHQDGEESHGGEDSHDDGGSHDDGHNHDVGAPEEPSASVEVSLRTEGSEQHFAPHVVWVEPGGTVTWHNESGQHNSVAYHPENDKPLRIPQDAEPWETELLSEEGATASRTFDTEGVYDYFCSPHEAVGMVGTVIVGHPDAHGQPALEEPQSSLPDGARHQLADLGEMTNEALGHTH